MNKKQEQFEYRIYSKQIYNILFTKFPIFSFFEKINTHLFPDVKIKTKFNMDHIWKTDRSIKSY
jgi:hypothetical protein